MDLENLNQPEQIPYEPVPEYVPVTPPPAPEVNVPEQIPTEPRPQVNYSVEQPVYTAPVEQPVYTAPVEQPVYTAPVEQPVYGAPVEQPVYGTPTAQDPYAYGTGYGMPPVPPAETPKKKNKWILPVILGAVALLGALALVYFLFLRPSISKEDAKLVGKWHATSCSIDGEYSSISVGDMELSKNHTGKMTLIDKDYTITNFSYVKTDSDGDMWFDIKVEELGTLTAMYANDTDHLLIGVGDRLVILFERR